jgi:membrane-associated phospholipid phosphatase
MPDRRGLENRAPLRRAALLVLALGAAASPAASSAGDDRAKGRFVRSDEGLWLLSTAAVAVAGEAVCGRADAPRLEPLRAEAVFGPDRFAVRMNVPLASPLSYAGLAASAAVLPVLCAGGRTRRADACAFAESQLLTLGLTRLIKGAARRPRPYAYGLNGASIPPSGDAFRSFVSWHAAAAFNGAVLAGLWIGDGGRNGRTVRMVRVAGPSLAVLTAAGRVLSGRHFPTDVLAGAAVGAAAGWLVATAHGSGP